MKTEKIYIQIDNDKIELTGQAKTDFIAQREADNAEREARETEQAAVAEQKQAILERLGLTEDELKVVLNG
jgi:hypothetical protein